MTAAIARPTSQLLSKAAHALFHLSWRVYQPTQEGRVRPWRAVDGDKTLRLDYDLGPESVVFDVGGYDGQWASDIAGMYGCTVHVFEPVPSFAARIEQRFRRNVKMHVHPVGLAGRSRMERISVADVVSSTLAGSPATIAAGEACEVRLMSVADAVREYGGRRVDLMKVNIEGGEYELLETMVAEGIVGSVVDLQVQFHDFVPDAEQRVNKIRDGLSRTHQSTYCYPFVWENWRSTAGAEGRA